EGEIKGGGGEIEGGEGGEGAGGTDQIGGSQEDDGGGSQEDNSAAKKTTSAKRKAPSADSSDFYEDDVPEEEEATSPPPPMKKLRSAGPISPMPPPPPRTLQQPVQYMESAPVPAGKPGGMFKTVTKQVSFTPPGAPANHPAVVAERRRRMHAIEPVEQDDGPSGSHTGPAGKSRMLPGGISYSPRTPQLPLVPESRAQRPKPAATPSAPQLPAQPANVAQMASQIAGQLAQMPPEQLAAFFNMFQPRNSTSVSCDMTIPEKVAKDRGGCFPMGKAGGRMKATKAGAG
ncbi:hypothetical protein B0H13DRAFT_1912290, partial [Mycena leptocephala]